jgi:hypothetical protein
LEATIEAHLKELHERYRVVEILCDPYQLHRSITTLKNAGLKIREFPQTTSNTTAMGQGLFDLLKGKNIKSYPSDELREQALNTVAIENPRGWRIAKEKASKKIDVIVALSMACLAAMEHGKPKTDDDIPIVIHKGKFETIVSGMDNEQQNFWNELTQGPISETMSGFIKDVYEGKPVNWLLLGAEEKRSLERQLQIFMRELRIHGDRERAKFFQQQLEKRSEN